jgi:hypothetical protein
MYLMGDYRNLGMPQRRRRAMASPRERRNKQVSFNKNENFLVAGMGLYPIILTEREKILKDISFFS